MTATTTTHAPHVRASQSTRSTGQSGSGGGDQALSALLCCDTTAEAASLLASSVPPALAETTLAIGVSGRDGMCRLQAVTGLSRSDRRSERIRAIESALDETILLDELVEYSAGQDGQSTSPVKTYAHLARLLGRSWIAGQVLRDVRGRVIGAWLIWGDREQQKTLASTWLRDAAPIVACALRAVARGDRNLVTRATETSRKFFSKRQHRYWTMGGTLALTLLAAAPVTYQVRCDVTLEPVTRRFVAAPFDATLDRSLVEPGDLVVADQLLAELDGRELRWELAALEADLGQARKTRDQAMAERKTAAAQLARLEMQQLQSRISLLQDRKRNLTITSPLTGVVTSGDLARVAGAPLTVGQTMFEIAPLDELIVEVAISQSEIAYVESGTSVAVRLDAFPRRKWRGTVDKIHPRSEIRDNEPVFVADVKLTNEDGTLRPGMRGRAKVAGCRAPLAWHVFHKPWEAAARWLAW